MQHGTGPAHRLDRARPRSPRLCAGGLRRRRTDARLPPGPAGGYPQGHRPVRRRRRLGDRSPARRPEDRPGADADDRPARRRRFRSSRSSRRWKSARGRTSTAGVDGDEVVWSRAAYMRYVGQGYDLRVDLPDLAVEGPADIAPGATLPCRLPAQLRLRRRSGRYRRPSGTSLRNGRASRSPDPVTSAPRSPRSRGVRTVATPTSRSSGITAWSTW